MRDRGRKRTARLTEMGFLTAVALVISYLESLLPLTAIIPLPGIKLGLSNIVILFALCRLDASAAILILVARILLSTLLFATPAALIYSLAGGLLALGVMALCLRSRKLSPIGVSIAGAAAHQIGQLGTATLLLRSSAILYYLTPMLLVSLGTGTLTAICYLLIRDVPLPFGDK